MAMLLRSEVYSLLEVNPQDYDDIKDLKNKMMENFHNRFPLTDVMVLAAVLNPTCVNLLDVKTYLREKNLTAVEFLIKSHKEFHIPPVFTSVTISDSVAGEKEQSYIDELVEKHSTLKHLAEKESTDQQSAVERECYLLLTMSSKVQVKNVLVFWKENAKLLPNLSIMASMIFCIPATSTPSERNFSYAGLVLNSRRSQILPDNLDKILFIHNNYTFLKEMLETTSFNFDVIGDVE